jgi:hypothetical protein
MFYAHRIPTWLTAFEGLRFAELTRLHPGNLNGLSMLARHFVEEHKRRAQGRPLRGLLGSTPAPGRAADKATAGSSSGGGSGQGGRQGSSSGDGSSRSKQQEQQQQQHLSGSGKCGSLLGPMLLSCLGCTMGGRPHAVIPASVHNGSHAVQPGTDLGKQGVLVAPATVYANAEGA